MFVFFYIFQISGFWYKKNVLSVQQVLCIPKRVADFFSHILEPIFSSAEPVSEASVGMGATVDIQRQQRIELLDQQIMFSQISQLGRRQQEQV